jgi:hypothetical protein
MGSKLPGKTEQLEDVALPISDMDATPWMLSFLSIGTHVGLILRFNALVPWNLSRFQNLIAASPSGKPSTVVTKLECMRMPQLV